MADLQEAIHKRSKLFWVSILLLFWFICLLTPVFFWFLFPIFGDTVYRDGTGDDVDLFVAMIYSLWRCFRNRILKLTNKVFII